MGTQLEGLYKVYIAIPAREQADPTLNPIRAGSSLVACNCDKYKETRPGNLVDARSVNTSHTAELLLNCHSILIFGNFVW